jgi:carbonic anhydrase/acetyltransferase-like protein (isoleucine patch superfamily)
MVYKKMIKTKFNGIVPRIDPTSYISENVSIIGDVEIGQNSSVWFGSVLRGDVASISVGKNTNIQDGTIVHTSRFDGPTVIGDNVTIGHRAIIHACTVRDYGFVGMGAIVMDKAIIERYGFVASGALIPPGKVVKSKQLWAGVPARYIRDISEEEVLEIKESAAHYVRLAGLYKQD